MVKLSTHFGKRKVKKKMSSEKFKKWLDKCPVKYDEIPETSDENILTINFHSKDIYETNKEVKDE